MKDHFFQPANFDAGAWACESTAGRGRVVGADEAQSRAASTQMGQLSTREGK